MLKNGFYNVAGAVIRSGLTVLTIPLIIRLIGVEEYGLWTLVSTMIGIVGLAEVGLSISTTVFLSRDLASDNADGISQTLTVTFGAMLLLATLAGITLWAGAPSLVGIFSKLEPSQYLAAIKALQLGGLVVWARLLQQVLVGVEQAYQRYEVKNLLNTLQVGFNNLGMLVVVWLGGHTVELMALQSVTSIGGVIAHSCAAWLLVRNVKLRLVWNQTKVFAIVRYSLMTWLTSLGGALFTKCDRLIIGGLLDTESLGVYAAITSITGQINSFSALPVQPLLPTLSNLIEKQGFDQAALQQQVKQALQINGIVALGLGGALLTLTPVVINLMIPGQLTSEYALGFRLAAIIYSIYSVNAVGYYILFSVDAVNISLVIQLISGSTSLFLIAIGANYFGLIGAIIGNAGYLGVWGLNIWGMKRIKVPLKTWSCWMHFLALWFGIVVFLNLLLFFVSSRFSLMTVLLFLLQNSILLGYFIKNNPLKLNLGNER